MNSLPMRIEEEGIAEESKKKLIKAEGPKEKIGPKVGEFPTLKTVSSMVSFDAWRMPDGHLSRNIR